MYLGLVEEPLIELVLLSPAGVGQTQGDLLAHVAFTVFHQPSPVGRGNMRK